MNSHKFNDRVDAALNGQSVTLREGTIISVNKLISDTIRVPEGEYIVAVVTTNRCTLIPTSEASGEKFEVFKHTLAGFFNPEVHRRTVDTTNGPIIADSKS